MIEQTTKKKRSSLSYQTIGAIVLGVICLLLVGALLAVNFITSITPFELDGTTYYVRREKNEDGSIYYKLTDRDKNSLPMTDDGYYVAASGSLIKFDPASGEVGRYAAIDTVGNEQVGLNDRILIFPYTTRSEIQSIQVNNSNGSYAFYRLRKYEDTDKSLYTCYMNKGVFYLIDDSGKEYNHDGNGVYSLPSGTKLLVDQVTGIMRTLSFTDFDGKEYTVEKRSGDSEYRIYNGNTPLDETLSATAQLTDDDGNPYTATLYSYAVTDYGTMVGIDGETGIIEMQTVREYVAKSEKYYTYHFLYRNGKYVMCDQYGEIITDVSLDDKDYYSTKNNSYISFNEGTGGYNVRVRKNYYIMPDASGVYSLYVNGKIAATNSLGYGSLPDGTYLYFDSASGSYSIMKYNGESYDTVDSKYLNDSSFADISGEFSISGHEKTTFDPSLFAALVVSSGYTITAAGGKLSTPTLLESGDINFSAYGLTETFRTDESGKLYHYTPSSFVLTDLGGNVHKIIIGDPIASDAGYYVRYEGWDGEKFVERQAVYILLDNLSTGYTSTYETFDYYTLSDTVLAPVERLITPMAIYPMQQNSYFDVSNFTIMTYNPDRSLNNLLNSDPEDDDDYYDISVRFSYHDLSERTNTINSSFPFVMETSELYGYVLDSDKAQACLTSLMELDFTGVSSLTASDADMVRFGLSVPQYIIYYKSPISGYGEETEQVLNISALSPNGTYYIYSSFYDMIVEVEKNKLPFLTWDSTEWLSDDVYYYPIGYCDTFKLESGDYWANFKIYMSRTLETTINTSGGTNYIQKVVASSDRKNHTLTLTAKLGANLSTGINASAEIITVDFSTLRNYYTYVSTGKRPEMTEDEAKKLDEFMSAAIAEKSGTSVQNGTYMTSNSIIFTTSSGASYQVVFAFSFSHDGEITAAVSTNNETPSLIFSMKAYESYEKLMFSEKMTEDERRIAFDFYTVSNVSASAKDDYEKVTATNSDGEKKTYTNDKIVTTYADGTKSTDYCMTNDTKVFFQVEGSEDLIGVGTRWIRLYPIKNGASNNSEYKEIKDETYTFTATASQVVTVDGAGNRVTLPGGLSSGKYKVTIDSDSATVTDENGNVIRKYLRYAGTSVLSSVYDGWLWATYEGLCEIPEEQMKEFRESDDSTCQVKITVKTKTGQTLVFRTYPYSERRSYVTVNGNGEFFMLRSFVDKVIDAAHLVFDNIYVPADKKYND